MSERLRIEYWALAKLERWPRNPKKHALDVISESMDRFGFTSPILIDENSGKIVAGHGRLDTLLLRKKNKGKPPKGIFEREGDWFLPVVRGLEFKNEVEAEAYLLADNETVILGGYDAQILDDLIKAHSDNLVGTGFTDIDLLVSDAPSVESELKPTGFVIRVDVKTMDERRKVVKLLEEMGFKPQVNTLLM